MGKRQFQQAEETLGPWKHRLLLPLTLYQHLLNESKPPRILAILISVPKALSRTGSKLVNYISQKPTGADGLRSSSGCERLHFPACSGNAGPKLPASAEAAGPAQTPPHSVTSPLAPPPPLGAEPMGRPHTAECAEAGAAAELRVVESGGKFILGRRRRFCGSG